MSKTALIAGITGQDGAYLAHHLLGQGYRVVGTTRDIQSADLFRLHSLGILDKIDIYDLLPSKYNSILNCVSKIMPDEIYNMSGQSSVGLSFVQPVECMESIYNSTLNFLEVIRHLDTNIRYFSAGSSECFGSTDQIPATEETPFRPCSPYAVAKASTFWLVATYRQSYGLFACTGILANHESPLRSESFVVQKLIQGVKAIKEGRLSKISLNNIDVWRDWGWAPDYVQAMALMLQAEIPSDFIIASGQTISLRQIVYKVCSIAGLDPEESIEISDTITRPNDIRYTSVSPALINSRLGWSSTRSIDEILSKMFDDDLF